MTLQEFENRVKMTVSADEFDAIHVVYMASDLDKDEFCAMWRKMNRKRIARAKAEAKKQAEEQMKRDCTFALFNKLRRYSFDEKITLLAPTVLNEKECCLLENVGIAIKEYDSYYGCEMYITVLTLCHAIYKKYNFA